MTKIYIGYSPDLYFGGFCHGENEEQVYDELYGIVRDEVEHRRQRDEAVPCASVR